MSNRYATIGIWQRQRPRHHGLVVAHVDFRDRLLGGNLVVKTSVRTTMAPDSTALTTSALIRMPNSLLAASS